MTPTVQPDNLSETVLGGVSSPAFCLLDGFFRDPKSEETSRVTLPIARLPATLGRSHETSDKHFVGMGMTKALSRLQCKIEYRVVSGTLGQSVGSSSSEFTYRANKLSRDDFVNPGDVDISKSSGFFTIENLGKNKLIVNGSIVQQGETALLQDESAVKIASFSLYFFLPSEASTKTISIGKKRKRPTPETPTSPQAAKKQSSSAVAPGGKVSKPGVSELELLSTSELLKLMTIAVNNDSWDRKDQSVGATLSFRAVTEAAKDPKLQEATDGVSRGQVLDWIEKSPQFKTWNEQMRSKLEFKSFQSSITKAMVKAGYERTSSTGRYIKWVLPPEYRKHDPTSSQEEKQSQPASLEAASQPTAPKPDKQSSTKNEPTKMSSVGISDQAQLPGSNAAKDEETNEELQSKDEEQPETQQPVLNT